MRRRAPRSLRNALLATGAAVAVGLVACPLPQPIPEVARVDGGTVTVPPRILTSTALPSATAILVSRACPQTSFTLSLSIEDLDTTEQVEARWFVDYSPPDAIAIQRDPDRIPGPDDPSITTRPLPPFSYAPDPHSSAPVHVVEVVVSNGFAPNPTAAVPYPNRMPSPGYETQVFRWVFELVDGDPGICHYP